MRRIYGIGPIIAAMLADAVALNAFKHSQIADFSKPKTYRTGKKYPFSSKRQNDRFSRQLAECKVNFAR